MAVDQLLEAFGITLDDLVANRGGRLGLAQARKLRRSGLNNVVLAIVAGAILAGILFGLANRPLKPAQWITALVLFAAVLAAGIAHYRRMHAAAAAGVVERLSGTVLVSSRGKSGFFLEVSDRSFRMPVRPWHIKSGARYHVYVVPSVNTVVGMEPLATEGVPPD